MTSPLVHAQHRAELSLVAGGLSSAYPAEILDPSDALPLTTLIVDLGVDGDDQQRSMSINVMPMGDDFDAATFLQFFVPMPFPVPAARLPHVGFAASKVNAAMALGHFAIGADGELYFRYMHTAPAVEAPAPPMMGQLITMIDFLQSTFSDVLQGVAEDEIDIAVIDGVIASIAAG